MVLTTPFASEFISVLAQFEPKNVGVVGPSHSGFGLNTSSVLTLDFVHRTHLDIFHLHYPTRFGSSLYWLGEWMSHVYGENNTLSVHAVEAECAGGVLERYRHAPLLVPAIEDELFGGRAAILAFLENHKLNATAFLRARIQHYGRDGKALLLRERADARARATKLVEDLTARSGREGGCPHRLERAGNLTLCGSAPRRFPCEIAMSTSKRNSATELAAIQDVWGKKRCFVFKRQFRLRHQQTRRLLRGVLSVGDYHSTAASWAPLASSWINKAFEQLDHFLLQVRVHVDQLSQFGLRLALYLVRQVPMRLFACELVSRTADTWVLELGWVKPLHVWFPKTPLPSQFFSRKELDLQSPRIAIAIPTYNRAEYVKLCAAALNNTRQLGNADIWVFDDGSEMYGPATLMRWFRVPAERVVVSSERLHADARAFSVLQWFSQSQYDWLITLDSDLIVKPSWLQELRVLFPKSRGAMTAFHSKNPSHQSGECHDGLCSMGSLGNAGMVWTKSVAVQVVAHLQTKFKTSRFDYGWSEYLDSAGIPLLAVQHSLVAHVGMHGSWGIESRKELAFGFNASAMPEDQQKQMARFLQSDVAEYLRSGKPLL
jgi:hypothetical protein